MDHYDNGGKKNKRHKKLMANVTVEGCAANTFETYKPEIVIPPVPPTDMQSSSILQISYEIKVGFDTNYYLAERGVNWWNWVKWKKEEHSIGSDHTD